jgi:type I restriction enzyme R subunit
LPDFPTHDALTARYATDTGIDITAPGSALLFMADAAAFNKPRYYQDAAIALPSKVLSCEKAGAPARILLSLATGAATVIAANLLWRLAWPPSRRSSRDRDEPAPKPGTSSPWPFPRAACASSPPRRLNASQRQGAIATYQTLGLDESDEASNGDAPLTASFLSQHYPENAFSAIIIDECHRSAWGAGPRCSRNPDAIHIGLTATLASCEASGRPRPTPRSPPTTAPISANLFTNTP